MYSYQKNQIAQTRKFIYKAFFELLEKKNIQKIKISELCQTAEISRRTFYRHFSSADDIGKQWLKEKEKEYEGALKTIPLKYYDPAQIAQEFFTFWNPYRKNLQLLLKGGFPLFETFLLEGEGLIGKRSSFQFKILPIFLAGGFYSLLISWLKDPMLDTEEYVEDIKNELKRIKLL